MATNSASISATISAERVVLHLRDKLGIKFVAFDFDHTILKIHTGGFWQDTAEILAQEARPEMVELLPRLVEANDIYVGVVTFSSQPKMVRAVVESMLPLSTGTTAGCSAVFPIRGVDGSWKTPKSIHRDEMWWNVDSEDMEEEQEGKQPHMVSAIQELEFLVPNLEVTKSTTVLIDDDPDNIRIAKDNAIRAMWLDPDNPERLFSDICSLN